MTKKVMSLLIVACVAMSMIGVTIGIVAYRKNKSETPAVHSLNAETAVDRAGVEKYSVNFNDFNPTDKRSYEIVPAGDLDVNLEFTKGKGKLAEVVYVTIRYGATVILTEDVTLPDGFTFSQKNVVIDGAGKYCLKTADGNCVIYGENMTIQNVTFG